MDAGVRLLVTVVVFFFNDAATTEIYTLSLHDALPICDPRSTAHAEGRTAWAASPGNSPLATSWSMARAGTAAAAATLRSEEHTSELQSRQYLVCRLLLEKKKTFSIMIRKTQEQGGEHP